MSWEKLTLADVSLNIQTGPFGTQLHQTDYSEEGTPVVMPKDLIKGKISEESIARVEEVHVNRLLKHKIETGDILYARRGDVGKCAFATDREKGWLCGTGCIRITVNINVANPYFVFYQLQKPETIGWIEKHAIGATMLNLNTSILSAVPIDIPSIPVQNKVVDILKVYDDLIENNQKQIKLLEEAAQRLYKEWFVDLRFPGYEDCEITNGVPEGWHFGRVEETINYHDIQRKPLSSVQRKAMKGKYRYYGATGILDFVNDYLFDGTYLLLGEDGTVITKEGEPILQYVTGQFWVNNHAHVLTGKAPYTTEYIYMMFSLMRISDVVTGAAQPKISQGRLSAKKVLIPIKDIVVQYQSFVKPYFDRILLIEKQNEFIKESRDRLLPKLMNGELEV